eukprot:m.912127 g.912127  ORF g.912127 m.912127 type:complete len:216 (-) comp23726_c1_seq15:1276-1923(-)
MSDDMTVDDGSNCAETVSPVLSTAEHVSIVQTTHINSMLDESNKQDSTNVQGMVTASATQQPSITVDTSEQRDHSPSDATATTQSDDTAPILTLHAQPTGAVEDANSNSSSSSSDDDSDSDDDRDEDDKMTDVPSRDAVIELENEQVAMDQSDCKSKNEVLPEELPFDESDECPKGAVFCVSIFPSPILYFSLKCTAAITILSLWLSTYVRGAAL